MNVRKQLVFWVVSFIILILLFSHSLGGFVLALYFVSFLFPVILGTTFVFNQLLVKRFLLQGKKWKFLLYFLYLLVISVYLEMLVMVLSFVILADYQFDNLGAIAGDIYLLTVVLYLIVFVNGFIEILIGFQNKTRQLIKLEKEKEQDQKEYIQIRSNRKSVNVEIEKIILIESLADYVKLHTENEVLVTKQKISALERDLPKKFIRIHRSFIVNAERIESFNKEAVRLINKELTLGRKYKQQALSYLNSLPTVDNTIHH